MPPVGMNFTPVERKAPRRFLIIFTPPAASAGKNLTIGAPAVSACESSLAVAMPGTIGRPPGATPNAAPAATAARTCSGVRSVPAPTTASGTSALMRAIAPAAACVRNVTSRTGSPPFTSARASGTAFASSSITITGTTPAFFSVSTMFISILSIFFALRLHRRLRRHTEAATRARKTPTGSPSALPGRPVRTPANLPSRSSTR